MTQKKETVGKIARDLMMKVPESRDPIEIQREMLSDFEKNVVECMEKHLSCSLCKDFYIVVNTKKERLMPNLIRNYFYPRHSAPTPTYDQTVYYYHRNSHTIEFLWVLPSKDTCEMLRDNAQYVPPEEWQLLQYVLDMYDDTLLQRAKKLNNEMPDQPLLQKG